MASIRMTSSVGLLGRAGLRGLRCPWYLNATVFLRVRYMRGVVTGGLSIGNVHAYLLHTRLYLDVILTCGRYEGYGFIGESCFLNFVRGATFSNRPSTRKISATYNLGAVGSYSP